METIKLKAHIGSDGLLKLELPTNLQGTDAEIVIVLHPTHEEKTDAPGWPIGYFEQIDRIEADDMTERPAQGLLEEREPIE